MNFNVDLLFPVVKYKELFNENVLEIKYERTKINIGINNMAYSWYTVHMGGYAVRV